ncbi:hypothetical protein NMG60_11035146 [Bertholletia excelsa]
MMVEANVLSPAMSPSLGFRILHFLQELQGSVRFFPVRSPVARELVLWKVDSAIDTTPLLET